MGSGCGVPIAEKSFVCHSTPHFDSTLRGGSYSVRSTSYTILFQM